MRCGGMGAERFPVLADLNGNHEEKAQLSRLNWPQQIPASRARVPWLSDTERRKCEPNMSRLPNVTRLAPARLATAVYYL
jgi:hypothetical protein